MQTKEDFLSENGWEKGSGGYIDQIDQWHEPSIHGWFTLEDAYMIERERLLKYIHTSITLNREILGRAPYAHNTINLHLATVAHCFGVRQENAMIRQCRLDKVGWQVKPEVALIQHSKKHSSERV